jgi:hypothetical protein
MVTIACVRVDWDRSAIPLTIARSFYHLRIGPTESHPFGRKGYALATAWRRLNRTGQLSGMLILDGDVAIDPYDYKAMQLAIDTYPDAVHVAPVRLWPVSTGRETWVWGHWKGPDPSQNFCDSQPDWFGFSFTYLPAMLIELSIRAGLRRWEYPSVDSQVSWTAKRTKTPVKVVSACHPKHLHY